MTSTFYTLDVILQWLAISRMYSEVPRVLARNHMEQCQCALCAVIHYSHQHWIAFTDYRCLKAIHMMEINHGLIPMFKAHRAHTGAARHLIVHRLPYSITRNKGLNSPRLIPGFTGAPSAGNIGMINTRATARFAQSHLPQGNGIQDRQISSIYRFQIQVTFRTHIREGDRHPTGNYRKHTESGEPVSVLLFINQLKHLNYGD